MNKSLFFLFLIGFTAQAQKDSVRLVDIQSSGCDGSYSSKLCFLSNEIVGDTTYIRFLGRNNCAGYYDPTVHLSGDSVLITINPGRSELYFSLNGKIISQEKYHKLKKRGADSRLEIHNIISSEGCDCCFNFQLKILGLDPSKNYRFIYNDEFIELNCQTKELKNIELR